MKNVTIEIDPLYVFDYELNCIKNDEYAKLCALALYKIPDYFWSVPASSSGKYHPKLSLGLAGLVRHTKAAFIISEHLLSHPLYAPFTDDEKDIARIAILLHDTRKQGEGWSHTVTEHPLLVREQGKPDNLSDELEVIWSQICDCIEPHMGIWNKNKQGEEILPVPKTELQKFVHLADFLASRPDIEVDTNRRESQSPTNSSRIPNWKEEPATDGQLTYIQILLQKAIDAGVGENDLPFIGTKFNDINKGMASNIINAYKDLLGISEK